MESNFRDAPGVFTGRSSSDSSMLGHPEVYYNYEGHPWGDVMLFNQCYVRFYGSTHFWGEDGYWGGYSPEYMEEGYDPTYFTYADDPENWSREPFQPGCPQVGSLLAMLGLELPEPVPEAVEIEVPEAVSETASAIGSTISDVVTSAVSGVSSFISQAVSCAEVSTETMAFASTSPAFVTEHFCEVCFAAGTGVKMADGSKKRIEQIERGELVDAVSDKDATGRAEPKAVVAVYHNGPKRLRTYKIGDQELRCTDEHPFYEQSKGWTPAANLEPGDRLRSDDDGWCTVHSISESGPPEPVYNLQIEDHHTYFVGDLEAGQAVLVHNSCYDTYRRLKADIEKARLAQAAYAGADLSEIRKTWEVKLLENDEETGFRAMLFVNKETGKVVLAFAGTNPTSKEDWIANFTQGLGMIAAQYEKAIEWATLAVTVHRCLPDCHCAIGENAL